MSDSRLTALLGDLREGPRVVRLTGPGAVGVASAWFVENSGRRQIELGTLPDAGGDPVWLNDAPGARIVADTWAACCLVRGLDTVILLTGRAADAGHPDLCQTLDCPQAAGPIATPTVVQIPVDLQHDIATHAAEGDLLRAHTAYEQLCEVDPVGAGPWCWLELARLLAVGRGDEVEAAAVQLEDRHRCTGRILLTVAETLVWLGRARRAQMYLDAAEVDEEAGVRQDASYLRAILKGALPQMRALRPHTPRLQAHRRKILRMLGEDEPWGDLAMDRAHTLEAAEEDALEAYLGIGEVARALRQARNLGFTGGQVYLPHHREEAVLSQVWTATRAGDLGRVQELLDGLDSDLVEAPTLNALRMLSVRAFLAAHHGHPGKLLACRARLRRLRARMWLSEGLVDALLPHPDQQEDPWCAAVYLRLLEEMGDGAHPALGARLKAQPTTPLILGPFILEHPLASGGMGTVWRGEHRLTGRPVAVKVVREVTAERSAQFLGEIETISRFDHPAIVSVLDILEVDDRQAQQSGGILQQGQLALVMELVSHGTLADHLGSLAWPDVHAVLVAVLEALAYAHAHGVVHRDLKPANILIGEGHTLRLADFGLARLAEDKIAGTPAYMAPEQFRRGTIGPAADLYAVGCIGWALVAALPPFLGSAKQLARVHSTEVKPTLEPMIEVPTGFEAWLRSCLRKRPHERFASAAEAAEALVALEDTMVAPSAQVALRRVPHTTFQLTDLLDLPAPAPEEEVTVPTRQLHGIFELRASWRPRLPTTRLKGLGDPPILWQREAQQSLWTLFARVLARRTSRASLVGSGTSMMVRWLRRRARISGLEVHETLVPGKVCIVDATGTDPAAQSWPSRERWLVLWRNEEVPGLRIEMERLSPGKVWWIVHCRLPLHPLTACEVAIESLGDPRLGIALAEDWLQDPGVEGTPNGLRTLGSAAPGALQTTEIWTARVAAMDPAQRAILGRLAVSPFPVAGAVLRQMAAPHDVDLSTLAIGVNDAWTLPRDLRPVMLQRLSPQMRREIHARAAVSTPWDSHRAVHECLADPSPEAVVTMLEALQDHSLAKPLQQLLALQIDIHLLQARETRIRLHLETLRKSSLVEEARSTDSTTADLARVAMFERVMHWDTELRDAVEAGLFDRRRPGLTLRLAHALCDQLMRAGRIERALELLDTLERRLGDSGVLRWTRARALKGDAAVAEYRRALEIAGPERASIVHVDLADELAAQQRDEEALAHLDASHGYWSLEADYNRVMLLISMGRDDEARAVDFRMSSIAFRKNVRIFAGLGGASLFLHLDEPTPMWEGLLEMCPPVRETSMNRVLHERLDAEVPSARVQALRALLG